MGLIVMFIYLVDYTIVILIAVISFCRASNTPVTVSTHQALAAHPVSVAFPSTHFARSLGTEGVSTRVGFPSEGAHFRVVGASRPKGTCPTFIGVVWLAIGLSSKA